MQLKYQKMVLLIEKINQAGDNIDSDKQLTDLIRSILSQCRLGSVSLANSIELIKSRDYRTDYVIQNTPWSKLGIKEHVFNQEERSYITGFDEAAEEEKARKKAEEKAEAEKKAAEERAKEAELQKQAAEMGLPVEELRQMM